MDCCNLLYTWRIPPFVSVLLNALPLFTLQCLTELQIYPRLLFNEPAFHKHLTECVACKLLKTHYRSFITMIVNSTTLRAADLLQVKHHRISFKRFTCSTCNIMHFRCRVKMISDSGFAMTTSLKSWLQLTNQ